jgi:hypothetical protein
MNAQLAHNLGESFNELKNPSLLFSNAASGKNAC